MKNLKFLFLLLILTTLFYSCNNDDADTDSSNSEIVGTWKTVRYLQENYTVSTIDGTTTSFITTLTSEGIIFDNYNTVFTENPNEVYSNGSMTTHITMNVSGNITEQDMPINLDPNEISTWEITGDQITFSPIPDNVESIENTILELTETSFKLKTLIHMTAVQNGVSNVSDNTVYVDYIKQ